MEKFEKITECRITEYKNAIKEIYVYNDDVIWENTKKLVVKQNVKKWFLRRIEHYAANNESVAI